MGTYLVTGGCGFIGSHLVDRLLGDGHRVRVLDDLSTGQLVNKAEPAELIKGCITDPASVRRAMAGVDGCFHLAAVASVQRCNEDWSGTHAINLTGTIRIFEAAKQLRRAGRPIPVVYASSAAVYGNDPATPVSETALPAPASAYGADKLGCELHARAAAFVHGVPTTGLRFFNVYGPRQDPRSPYSGVISIFCDRLRAGAPVEIHGDGEQSRDFIYVADVVEALCRAMQAAAEQSALNPAVFNVCTGHATSIRGLAETIAALCRARARIGFREARPGDIRHSLGDPAAALRALGFRSSVPLDEGLWQTLQAEEARSCAS